MIRKAIDITIKRLDRFSDKLYNRWAYDDACHEECEEADEYDEYECDCDPLPGIRSYFARSLNYLLHRAYWWRWYRPYPRYSTSVTGGGTPSDLFIRDVPDWTRNIERYDTPTLRLIGRGRSLSAIPQIFGTTTANHEWGWGEYPSPPDLNGDAP